MLLVKIGCSSDRMYDLWPLVNEDRKKAKFPCCLVWNLFQLFLTVDSVAVYWKLYCRMVFSNLLFVWNYWHILCESDWLVSVDI